MSEMPAGDIHDVIHHRGEVVAVVVPIAEYQQLRQAAEEQRVNAEFDAARAGYLARQDAGAIRYVSHEEAGLNGLGVIVDLVEDPVPASPQSPKIV
jgi:hypothetical protein